MKNRIESASKDILGLNEKFKNKKLGRSALYEQLENFGVKLDEAIIISFFPDDYNVFCGRLINQDGAVCHFDINLDNSDYSEFELDVGIDDFCKRNRRVKPWEYDIIASNLYKERIKNK